MKTFEKIIKVMLIVIAVAFLVSTLFALIYFTNGFTTTFKTMFLKYNDEILKNNCDLVVVENFDNEFTVHYVFDKEITSSENDFIVEVVKNNKNDFKFNVDDSVYAWSGNVDISNMYNLTKYQDKFVLNIDFDIIKHLKALFGDNIIFDEEDNIDAENKSYFSLIVKSYNESVCYIFDLYKTSAIIMDKYNIVI